MRTTTKPIDTYYVNIHIAGDRALARQVCAKFCMGVGLCVTVTDTDYIYTGGLEAGITIRLINYPRFPREESHIWKLASELAESLCIHLCQKGYTLESTDSTVYVSNFFDPNKPLEG